jgi:actin-related protein
MNDTPDFWISKAEWDECGSNIIHRKFGG